MKSKHITALAVALVLALAAAVGVSQTVKRSHMHGDGMFGGPMFGGHMLGFFADYLDLTDAQQAQAKEIIAKEKPTVRPLMQQIAQAHQQLMQLEMSGNFDESKVRELAAQHSQ